MAFICQGGFGNHSQSKKISIEFSYKLVCNVLRLPQHHASTNNTEVKCVSVCVCVCVCVFKAVSLSFPVTVENPLFSENKSTHIQMYYIHMSVLCMCRHFMLI